MIFEDIKVTFTVDTDKPDTHTAGLLRTYEALYEAAGARRPAHLYGFPPRGAG